MTRYRTLVSSALVVSSLGLLALPATAAPHDCGPQEARGAFWEHRAEAIELHHKKLLEALKLTTAQEGGWKKLLDAEHPKSRMAPGKAEDWSKLTSPERADRMLERTKEQQLQQTEHTMALKEFYATLTDEQKKVFDDQHSGPPAGKPARHGKPVPPRAPPDKAPAKP
jgi:Spy/CpxP family protein refolding chaperone